jgi:hypothetical protein
MKPVVMIDKVFRAAANRFGLSNSWNEKYLPYFGSQWWALTPECCSYLLYDLKKDSAYYLINKFTVSPDEHYIHTLIGNSKFSLRADGLQRFIGRGTSRLANLHHIHPSLSKWYTIDDWDEIFNSDKFFIRKVSSDRSKSLLDKIDKVLLQVVK